MRLFPRLVMLLACLPLLLPPGLCACGASEAQAAPKRANAGTPPKETHAPKCCGCRGHAKAESPRASFVPPPPAHPADHAPGCPAAPDAEHSKWTERAEPVDHLTAVAFVAVFAHLLAEAVRAEPGSVGSTPAYENPPLYLSHCALLF